MGIQINGQTDNISAVDGSLTISGAELPTVTNLTASGIITASGGISVAAGSTSSPSISPSGDSNTGIFFPSPDTIAFAEGGIEAARLDSNGRLGIGTTNPTSTVVIRRDNNAGVGAVLSLQNRGNNATVSEGTLTGITFGVDSSDAIIGAVDVGNGAITVENSGTSSTGIMKFRVFDGADSEAIKIVGNGVGFAPADGGDSTLRNGVAFANAGVAIDKGWGSFPGIMVFNTNHYGSTNQSEFRIHGWNRSYSSYPNSSGSDFAVNMRIDGASYISSDERHKTNIVDNPYGLNEVLQLQPRKFNRINSEGQIEEKQGDILGFIAQEVREVIPEAVNYYPDEDNPNEIGWCRAYSLCDGYIVSTLVNAVKEQNEIISQLKSRIETLESQINN
jgi:hypothetical protein